MKGKKRTLISSALAILLCGSLATGGTYALFTSESNVNIAATSGRVEVVAEINSVKVYSAEALEYAPSTTEVANYLVENNVAYSETITDKFAGTYYLREQNDVATVENLDRNYFYNRGYATLNEGTLTLTNITPGDAVRVGINFTNNSNVAIKYRIVISYTGDETLYNGLTKMVSYGEPTSGMVAYSSNPQVDSWNNWSVPDSSTSNVKTLYTDIILPVAAGNEYQQTEEGVARSVNLKFSIEAVQSNAKTDS